MAGERGPRKGARDQISVHGRAKTSRFAGATFTSVANRCPNGAPILRSATSRGEGANPWAGASRRVGPGGLPRTGHGRSGHVQHGARGKRPHEVAGPDGTSPASDAGTAERRDGDARRSRSRADVPPPTPEEPTDRAGADSRPSGGAVSSGATSLVRLAAQLPDTVLFQLETELAPDEAGVWREHRRLLFVGENAERLLGYTAEALLADGRRIYDLMHLEDLQRHRAAEAHGVTAMAPLRLDVRMTLPDGRSRVFDISAAPTPVPAQRPGGRCLIWNGAATDVTAARIAEAERARFTGVVESADDLVAVILPTGRIDFINAAGRRMLGLHPEDGMPVARDLWAGGVRGERMRRAVRTATRTGAWRGEAVLRRPDGSELPVSQTLVAHRAAPVPGRRRGRVTYFSTIMRDASRAVGTERALRAAGERTSIELRENAHRVKNLFALVPAIISLSARTATDVADFAASLRERVSALAQANAMTLGSHAGAVEMRVLVGAIFEPYAESDDAIRAEGPVLELAPGTASTVGLALHELTTNAVKHGALREREDGRPHGRVTLRWEASSGRLRIMWRESGGPPVEPPSRTGFGTSLIDRVIATQGGAITREWDPAGFAARIELSVV